MTPSAVWMQVEPKCIANALRHEAVEKINHGESELILDWSSVLRIDSNVARALEELASLAESRSAHVILRAVNVDIYRVLKELKLTPRFCFRG